jgi:hypothetical protein
VIAGVSWNYHRGAKELGFLFWKSRVFTGIQPATARFQNKEVFPAKIADFS